MYSCVLAAFTIKRISNNHLMPVPLSLTCLFLLLLPLLTLSAHHSHYPQLPLSFTPGSKPTSFTNLSRRRLSSCLRTDSTDFTTGLFLLSTFAFFFSFHHYSFCFLVLCVRLRWLFVSFCAHINMSSSSSLSSSSTLGLCVNF